MQVSHVRVDDLGEPQALGEGGGVADEFLGLGGLAAAWCGALSSKLTHSPSGCLPSLVVYRSKVGVYFCT